MTTEGRTKNFALNALQAVPRTWKTLMIAVPAFLWIALSVNLHRFPDPQMATLQVVGVIVAILIILIGIATSNMRPRSESTTTDDSSAENDAAFGHLESQPLYDYATDPEFMQDTRVS